MSFARKRGRPAPEEMLCPCCFRPGLALCKDFTPATGKLRLAGLRSLMRERGLGAYVVPSGDAHSSEYVAEADKRREWLTGFTGSAGTALVTETHALLWTDGRYFTQAEQQLAGSEWVLMRSAAPGVPTIEKWVRAHEADGTLDGPVGVDPALTSLAQADAWRSSGCAPIELVRGNLVDTVRGAQKPAVASAPVRALGVEHTGERVSAKLRRLADDLADAGCTATIVGALDQIAWIFNMRGSDIECNPVFLSYAVVKLRAPAGAGAGAPVEAGADCAVCEPREVDATLYLRALDANKHGHTAEHIEAHLTAEGCSVAVNPPHGRMALSRKIGTPLVTLRPYEEFDAAAAADAAGCADEGAAGMVLLETASTSLVMASDIPWARRHLVSASPIERFKAAKNSAEREGILSSGRRDAAAIVGYFAWLEEKLHAREVVTEAQGADEISRCAPPDAHTAEIPRDRASEAVTRVSRAMRRRRGGFDSYVGDSFPTISSSGANAAVIHYQPTHEACAVIDASKARASPHTPEPPPPKNRR